MSCRPLVCRLQGISHQQGNEWESGWLGLGSMGLIIRWPLCWPFTSSSGHTPALLNLDNS